MNITKLTKAINKINNKIKSQNNLILSKFKNMTMQIYLSPFKKSSQLKSKSLLFWTACKAILKITLKIHLKI